MHHHVRNIMLWVFSLSVLLFPNFTDAAPVKKGNSDLLIKQIMGLAYEENQTLNSRPYGLGDSLTAVENDWGPADNKGTVAANYYDHYVRFLYDGSTPQQTITAIDDWNPQLPTITLSQLKKTIGTPVDEREQEGNYYVTYSDHDRYKVIFMFETNSPNSKLRLYQLYPGK
ncbi:protein of unknown function [Seinonella peptonophila]|uniref:DUF4309 domain-containing protein n=1 Tax=Seinonella peptonophila TaxID=112248 RepID=A0A1M5BDJ1_9BACL|nr:DUF4309 domain-containing protein [Seinonella peptonophila]SHF40518.1 protein of unknown function [Seinonella peptonophila]